MALKVSISVSHSGSLFLEGQSPPAMISGVINTLRLIHVEVWSRVAYNKRLYNLNYSRVKA